MHILRGRRHCVNKKILFCLCFFMFFFFFWFTLWCFELCLVSMLCCSHCIVFVCWTYIHPYAIVLHWIHVRMIICFAMWSLQSFLYDCFSVWSSCSHVSHHVYLIAIYLLHYTYPLITCFMVCCRRQPKIKPILLKIYVVVRVRIVPTESI